MEHTADRITIDKIIEKLMIEENAERLKESEI
jgi:hypothetical protein